MSSCWLNGLLVDRLQQLEFVYARYALRTGTDVLGRVREWSF